MGLKVITRRFGCCLLTMAMVVAMCGSACAEWVAFDDFSSGTVDAGKWEQIESVGSFTYGVTNGALRIVKTVSAASEVESEFYLQLHVPEGANGIKMDVRIVDSTGTPYMYFKSQVIADDGPPTVKQETRSKLMLYDKESGGTGLIHRTSYRERATDESFLTEWETTNAIRTGTMNDWQTSSVQMSSSTVCMETEDTYFYGARIGSAMTDNIFAVKVGGVYDDTATIEIDNVYYHTGDVEGRTSSAGSTKAVVIPMF